MAHIDGYAGQPDTSSTSSSNSIAKRRKRGDWEDLKVTYCKATVIPPCGIEEGTYSSRTGCKTERIDNIKKDIGNIYGKVQIGGKGVIYHDAFRAAMQGILTMLHDSNEDHRMLLIHGVASIGKSTLAAALAYHIAQTGTDATLVKFDNTKVTNNKHVLTDQIGHYLAFYRDDYVILDHLDVNRLDSTSFQKWWIDNDPRKPIVAFTAGHDAPPGVLWKESNFIRCKVIDLQMNIDGVQAIIEDVFRHKESVLFDPEEVLQISRNFGRVCKLVMMSEGEGKVTLEEMADHLYDFTRFYNLKKTVIWSVWTKYGLAGDEERKEEARKPEYWRLIPDEVELFIHLIARSNSDITDKRASEYLDYFDIQAEMGNDETSVSSSDGFYVYDNDEDYYYYFRCFNWIHKSLTSAFVDTTNHEMFNPVLEIRKTVRLARGQPC